MRALEGFSNEENVAPPHDQPHSVSALGRFMMRRMFLKIIDTTGTVN